MATDKPNWPFLVRGGGVRRWWVNCVDAKCAQEPRSTWHELYGVVEKDTHDPIQLTFENAGYIDVQVSEIKVTPEQLEHLREPRAGTMVINVEDGQ